MATYKLFMPFMLFFGIFWFGLTVWLFLVGMGVVSFMTLLLFLNIKNWEMIWNKRITDIAVKNQNRVKIAPFQSNAPSVSHLLKIKPSHSLKLISTDFKNTCDQLEQEHEKIVHAYETERSKLFEEIKENDARVEKIKEQLEAKKRPVRALESINLSLKEEISRLNFELELLLKMDQEALNDALR